MPDKRWHELREPVDSAVGFTAAAVRVSKCTLSAPVCIRFTGGRRLRTGTRDDASYKENAPGFRMSSFFARHCFPFRISSVTEGGCAPSDDHGVTSK
ncbi:hypothetical protein MRX96_050835 [Rhipicephalus microplus]